MQPNYPGQDPRYNTQGTGGGYPVNPGYPPAPGLYTPPPVTGTQPVVNPNTMPVPPSGSVEDTGYAPELRMERSDNVYHRDSAFWQQMPDPQETMRGKPRREHYFTHEEVFREDKRYLPKKRFPGRNVIKYILMAVGVLAAVTLILFSTVPIVRTVQVEGNSLFTAEQIKDLAGIDVGTNYFFIDTAKAAQNIETNRYLTCERIHSPDLWTVVIRVRERQAATVMEHNGLVYYLDNRGMVLEEYLHQPEGNANLIHVKGLDLRRCDVGRVVTLNNPQQLYVYNEILVELKVMGALGKISELDMNNMDSIYLATHDGYSVRLGDGREIHQKIRSMLLTLDMLYSMGHGAGTVDVSAPVYPTYIPDDLL
ncbi:MAG: FtsQ-type POTRA domain-containing protein [Clostridiales bacterium]|nr:FtsQ-type POTRA domain-containing protein [Clostridiales bacterium]